MHICGALDLKICLCKQYVHTYEMCSLYEKGMCTFGIF